MIVDNLRGSRPFPLDKERKQRCQSVLDAQGMTITELAFHLGHTKVYVGEIISGRRLTDQGENEIADFFGLPHDAMFPRRTAEQIYFMRLAEQQDKEKKEEKRKARMDIRNEAISKLGVA